jgi:acyl-CoA synthetase (AMP-forming)/AMP-acid ligase II
VAVSFSNSPALPIALMAVNALGAIAIPLDPALTAEEDARVREFSEPQFLLSREGPVAIASGISLTPVSAAHDADEAELEGVSTILFTSGTTGVPKGVLLTDDGLLTNARSVVDYLQLRPEDRTLIFLPLHYSYPLSQLLTTWLAGGTVVLMKNLRFPRTVMKTIDEQGITGIAGVPASLGLLLDHAASSPRTPRYIMNAGGPLSDDLARRIQATFPDAELFNNYGCTEVGPRATSISYAEHPDRIGSIGRAISRVGVRLIRPDLTEAEPMETAEIVLSGPTLMKGYYRDPETTARRTSRWGFHTGDFAYADRDGFLYFQGRNDDIFKSGGEKVSAREIEEVMLQYQGVREVAVVPETDPLLGTVPIAYVVASDTSPPASQDLQVFCRSRLSMHKVPRRILFLPRLERTATGKLQKFRLTDGSGRDGASGRPVQ